MWATGKYTPIVRSARLGSDSRFPLFWEERVFAPRGFGETRRVVKRGNQIFSLKMCPISTILANNLDISINKGYLGVSQSDIDRYPDATFVLRIS